MRLGIIALVAALAAWPAAGETPPAPPSLPATPGSPQAPPAKPTVDAVWTKTKIIVCEVQGVQHCRGGTCETAPKLPSFRIDIGQQTMCGMVSGGCKNTIKIGQVGLDRTGTRLSVHALGVAFVVGVDADGAMNGADVVKGRVVAIHGRCVPG